MCGAGPCRASAVPSWVRMNELVVKRVTPM
jgi:hypothetical protein